MAAEKDSTKLPWKNFGLGLDSLHIMVEGNGESDVPGVDFKGNIDFDTTGVHLYLKAFFNFLLTTDVSISDAR
jgi:hypothetical protein